MHKNYKPRPRNLSPLGRVWQPAFHRRDDVGTLLLELVISMTVVTVGLLSILSSFGAHFRAQEETGRRDTALAALENVAELVRNSPFESLYDDFHDASLEAPGLEAPAGGPAAIDIVCLTDETNLPVEFGFLLDLDGSGALDNNDTSLAYELMPLHLSLSYATTSGVETRDLFLVLGQ